MQKTRDNTSQGNRTMLTDNLNMSFPNAVLCVQSIFGSTSESLGDFPESNTGFMEYVCCSPIPEYDTVWKNWKC